MQEKTSAFDKLEIAVLRLLTIYSPSNSAWSPSSVCLFPPQLLHRLFLIPVSAIRATRTFVLTNDSFLAVTRLLVRLVGPGGRCWLVTEEGESESLSAEGHVKEGHSSMASRGERL